MSKPEALHKVDMGSERGFGLVFALVFTVIGFWPTIFGDGGLHLWSLAVAALFLIVALAKPAILRPLNVAWFKLGMLLGRVVAPIAMLLVFLIAVTPTGLIMRLFGKDPLRLKPSVRNQDSYWIDRSSEAAKMGSMKNQF